MKQCTKCNEFKSLDLFVKRKDTQTYRGHCIECEKQRLALSPLKHREQRLEARKLRYQEHKEHELAVNKRWIEQNKERHSFLVKENYKSNKDKYVYHCAKARATKRNASPVWLTAEQKKQIQTEYSLAKWCSEVMGIQYEVDHIVPLQGNKVCGLHVPWNLRVITQAENRRKTNKLEVV